MIIVEDGTIVLASNSYATTLEADMYNSVRGRVTWDEADDDLKTTALISAFSQMESRFRGYWKGNKRNDSTINTYQVNAWPRKNVKDEDGISLDPLTIPILLKYAQIEIAYLILGGSEFLQAEIDTGESRVKKEKVDVLEVSYFENAQYSSTYPLVDNLLRGLATTAAVSLSMHISVTEEEANQGNPRDIRDYTDYFNVI